MNKRKLLALVLTGVMAISTLAGCGSSDTKTSDTDVKTSETAETSDKNVLRVGMECAYACLLYTSFCPITLKMKLVCGSSLVLKIFVFLFGCGKIDLKVARNLSSQEEK